jgi:hypothetical protein
MHDADLERGWLCNPFWKRDLAGDAPFETGPNLQDDSTLERVILWRAFYPRHVGYGLCISSRKRRSHRRMLSRRFAALSYLWREISVGQLTRDIQEARRTAFGRMTISSHLFADIQKKPFPHLVSHFTSHRNDIDEPLNTNSGTGIRAGCCENSRANAKIQ